MHSRNSKSPLSVFILVVLNAMLVFGCAHQPIVGPKLESSAVAREFELSGCKISVPMSHDEVLVFADKMGNPNLATFPEWTQAISLLQSGDQLRHVYCPKNGDNFFGVFRESSVLFKFGSMLY